MEEIETECCTPNGQIKRYKDCIGCDKKPLELNQNKMEQTAVNWLIDKAMKLVVQYMQGTLNEDTLDEVIYELGTKAKAMEKEQIMDAREDGHLSTYAEYGSTPKCYLDGGHEQYYNETFKSE